MMQYIRRQKQKEKTNKIYLDGKSENSVMMLLRSCTQVPAEIECFPGISQ